MNSKRIHQSRGFTIIEVILVLALSGLILMGVFLVYPSIKQNERDNQRKHDAALLSGAFERYARDHHGTYPSRATVDPVTGLSTADEFLTGNPTQYLPVPFNDPKSGTPYVIGQGMEWVDDNVHINKTFAPCPAVFSPPAHITVYVRVRQLTLRMCLEQGGFRDFSTYF